MRIWLDPERLAKLGAHGERRGRRRARPERADRRGASPARRPPPAGSSSRSRSSPRAGSRPCEEFRDIVLRAEPDGSLLRLGDVARVELGAQSYNGFTRLSGQPTVTHRRLPAARGERARRLRRGPRRAGAALATHSRPASSWLVRYDPTRFVAESIREVMQTLGEAMLLVFLVVFVFLQDWRTTLIPAVTIPVSLHRDLRGAERASGSRSTRSRSSRSCSRSASSSTTRSWWSRTSRACSPQGSRAARRCAARWAR